jgi:hypothetical protein
MTVTNKSFYHVEHEGQTHYFCGAKCKLRFTSQGLRPAAAWADKSLRPGQTRPLQRLTRRTGWMLSLVLLAALLLAERWLRSA